MRKDEEVKLGHLIQLEKIQIAQLNWKNVLRYIERSKETDKPL